MLIQFHLATALVALGLGAANLALVVLPTDRVAIAVLAPKYPVLDIVCLPPPPTRRATGAIVESVRW